MTALRLVCIENLNRPVAAAANGSNRIVLRCLPSPGINVLTCQNDLY